MDVTDPGPLVVFELDDRRYALRLAAVERVVHAVEITPLPEAPEAVLGVIRLHNRIVPAFDLRRRFGLPGRELNLTDHLIIARTSRRTVALVADRVLDVVQTEAETISSREVLPDLPYVEGIIRLPDGLVFIHDLNTFLSLQEEEKLEGALGT